MNSQGDWKEFSNQYYELITTEFSGLNLTALKTADEIYYKQVLDSIEPLNQIPTFIKALMEANVIVDLGTGGGFPLLALACALREKNFVGVDAREKKLIAVAAISRQLGLKNVKTLHARFDDIIFDQKNTVCVVKAVGKVHEIIAQIYTSHPMEIFFYKGNNFYELEIEELKNLKNNGQLIEIYDIMVENLEKRHIAHCKIMPNVPRGTKSKLFSKNI